MKFLHTSDWHLGRQCHNVSLIDDQKHVLNQVLDYVEREAVDVVIIAGDVYDRAIPPTIAVDLLDETLNKICLDFKVPVIMIPGNHDSADRLKFGASHFRQAGLHILGELRHITKPITFPNCPVHFYGVPYTDPERVRATFEVEVKSHDEVYGYLLEQITQKPGFDRQPNVLISHCFLDGCEESDSERPLAIGGAERVNYQPFKVFDYVALGHLHRPQFKGKESIQYCGSLLKYSFSEQHQAKGVTLVEMDGAGLQSVKRLPLTPLRNMRVIEGEFKQILKDGKSDPNADDYVQIRLTDTHALLDPMNYLREVYPNVLELQKIGTLLDANPQLSSINLAKQDEFSLFADFFTQVQGEALTPEQAEALKTAIAAVHQEIHAQ
ncbi:exonuclease SbcCD subunit D [Synechocystis salina LEGE 06155]|nr:exonuclease SbcCD subunit D [Synechocystis salina LEGE 06155]